jgi:predicted ATP-binding protein involved in virulence
MLKKLNIKNFTVFTDVQIEFSKGLNIVIGDNATGKSFMLKLGYSVMYVLSRQNSTLNATKTLANKLYNVFKPNSLGHLNRNGSGRQRTQITVALDLPETFQFSFAKIAALKSKLSKPLARHYQQKRPSLFHRVSCSRYTPK